MKNFKKDNQKNDEDNENKGERGEYSTGTPDYETLAEIVGLDSQDKDSSSISTLSLSNFSFEENESDSNQNSEDRRSCSMSLSSLMHAEELLKKQLPVVRGGSHVEFTKEDLVRIKDPNVLEFLARNSNMFGKYLKSDSTKKENEAKEGEKCVLPTISAADVQKRIEEFQREIDTFITAVDNTGKKYNIELNSKGTLHVPIMDDVDEISSQDNSSHDDVAEVSQISYPGTTDKEDVGKTVDKTSLTSVEEELPLNKESISSLKQEEQQENALPFLSSPRKEPTNAPSLDLHAAASNSTGKKAENINSSFPSSFQILKSRKNYSAKQRNKVVVPNVGINRFSLLPDEEARINNILDNDTDVDFWKGNNPFYLSENAKKRFSEIDKSLNTFRCIRGAEDKHIENSSSPIPQRKDPSISIKGRSAAALGNKYMEEIKERQKISRALAAVNAKLMENQREIEGLPMKLRESIPEEINQFRPTWARTAINIASDQEITDMIQQAKSEEEESKKFSLNHSPSKQNDPYASLLQQVRDVRAQAECLLGRHDVKPFELTPLSLTHLESSSDFSELGEIPENILGDMHDMV